MCWGAQAMFRSAQARGRPLCGPPYVQLETYNGYAHTGDRHQSNYGETRWMDQEDRWQSVRDVQRELFFIDSAAAYRAFRRSRCRDQSRNTTLSSELLIFKPPLYSMKPSFRNLFMKKFTRERVVPTISANVSCDTLGNVR